MRSIIRQEPIEYFLKELNFPIVKDDDNSAAGGTTAAKALITEGVQIVIGSSGSSVSAAMATDLVQVFGWKRGAAFTQAILMERV